VLTALSEFWFNRLASLCPHHMIEVVRDRPPRGFEGHADLLRGRAMLCKKAEPIPFECVARGYLAGSGWADYQQTGRVCGIELPAGLTRAARLPEPIFTPATKAQTGHDENVPFERMAAELGHALADALRDLTLSLYVSASEYAAGRGILLADTKFEFGLIDGRLTLIDEAVTPDSSRFWPAAEYRSGTEPPSYDKQFVRNHLQRLCDEGRWNKQSPAPSLPSDVIEATAARYLEANRLLTGRRRVD
jgi:phosphoribosylaminoimidazole-succinocarboxamide synthase